MMIDLWRKIADNRACSEEGRSMDAEYEPCRKELAQVGLSEAELRQMDPDDRVAVLEQAQLDPYDYIYLAC